MKRKEVQCWLLETHPPSSWHHALGGATPARASAGRLPGAQRPLRGTRRRNVRRAGVQRAGRHLVRTLRRRSRGRRELGCSCSHETRKGVLTNDHRSRWCQGSSSGAPSNRAGRAPRIHLFDGRKCTIKVGVRGGYRSVGERREWAASLPYGMARRTSSTLVVPIFLSRLKLSASPGKCRPGIVLTKQCFYPYYLIKPTCFYNR